LNYNFNHSNVIVTIHNQVYDDKDYRNIRFANSTKVVNKNWAIKLIAEEPIIKAKERVVACNGGGGPLGHPKVYINLVMIDLSKYRFFFLPVLIVIFINRTNQVHTLVDIVDCVLRKKITIIK
jgi:uncharacterized Zn-finger protein